MLHNQIPLVRLEKNILMWSQFSRNNYTEEKYLLHMLPFHLVLIYIIPRNNFL